MQIQKSTRSRLEYIHVRIIDLGLIDIAKGVDKISMDEHWKDKRERGYE